MFYIILSRSTYKNAKHVKQPKKSGEKCKRSGKKEGKEGRKRERKEETRGKEAKEEGGEEERWGRKTKSAPALWRLLMSVAALSTRMSNHKPACAAVLRPSAATLYPKTSKKKGER